jgi:hypothetical protein
MTLKRLNIHYTFIPEEQSHKVLIGRIVYPDITVQSPGYTQSYNRYSYCFNNPLKYTDPSGWYGDNTTGGEGETGIGWNEWNQYLDYLWNLQNGPAGLGYGSLDPTPYGSLAVAVYRSMCVNGGYGNGSRTLRVPVITYEWVRVKEGNKSVILGELTINGFTYFV